MSEKFSLGRIVITPSAMGTLDPADVRAAVQRHASGDWGDLSEHDRNENEASLVQGFRLLSAYADRRGTKFWVITEADLSTTTVLLPEDY